MNVTLEDAYREACLALGEAIVRERLLSANLVQNATSPNDSAPGGNVAGDSGVSAHD